MYGAMKARGNGFLAIFEMGLMATQLTLRFSMRGRRLMMGEVKNHNDKIQRDGWCGLQIREPP